MAGKRKRQDQDEHEVAFEQFKQAVAQIAAVPKAKVPSRAPSPAPGKKRR